MVLFTSWSSLTWGNLQVLHLASLPGIYLLSTPNNQLLTSLQRLYDDRIHVLCQQGRQVGQDMMALWGNLNICPHLNYLELPYHMTGELLSISHLKIWGNIQEPVMTWPIS